MAVFFSHQLICKNTKYFRKEEKKGKKIAGGQLFSLLLTCLLLQSFGFSLGFGREFTFEIRLNHQACHRSRQIGTKAAVLHIDTDGNLGIIHRGKGYKG